MVPQLYGRQANWLGLAWSYELSALRRRLIVRLPLLAQLTINPNKSVKQSVVIHRKSILRVSRLL